LTPFNFSIGRHFIHSQDGCQQFNLGFLSIQFGVVDHFEF